MQTSALPLTAQATPRSSVADNPAPHKRKLSGLWIPLITPFRNGLVSHAELTALMRHLATQGVAGWVACGSTGEAAALEAHEQLAVLDTVLDSACGLPVVMGVGGDNLKHALDWVHTLNQHAAPNRLAGLLVPPPSYIRPSQAGIIAWFHAIAEASTAPVWIYDIPYRTGVTLSLETLLTLAAHPNIVAIKDCGGDGLKTQTLIADQRLQVFAGEDSQLFTTLALGGSGAIAASGHAQTANFSAVIKALQQGELAKARAAWLPLLPLVQALFEEPNPAPVKALLALQGRISTELRAPMQSCSNGLNKSLQNWA